VRAIAVAADWAKRIKRDVVAIWIAARDPRVPWTPRLLAGTVAAYALSPIDLIPDFIPLLGQLDDLLIVAAGLWLAAKLVPDALMEEFRAAAERVGRPTSLAAAVAIASLWVAAAAASLWLIAFS
jgi:uncharacterized membrane protein YkvA (DUF1232 family)